MIGSEGQYLFSASVADYNDFLSQGQLEEFTIIEEAGNVLPTFQSKFTYNDDLLSRLHEANPLKIKMGRNKEELEDIELKVTNKVTMRVTHGQREYNISGLLNALPYVQEPDVEVFPNSTSISALTQVASRYFDIDTNILTTRDKQNWIRANSSPKKFVNDLWLHSNIPSSFMSVAITNDSKMVINDMRKKARLGFLNYDWRFIQQPISKNDITYNPNIVVEDKSGFLNSWMGIGREILTNDLETGDTQNVLNKATPMIALTSDLAEDPDITKRFGGTHYQTENHHKKYWESYYSNLMNLSKFSSVKLTVKTIGNYFPIRPLDIVMLNEKDTANTNRGSEQLSGLYFVSKVSRTISANSFSTVVQLVRESINQIRKD